MSSEKKRPSIPKEWNRLDREIKVPIEILATFSLLGLLWGSFNLLITKGIEEANEFINFVGLAGFLVGVWGFIKSWQAASKSDTIERKLIETGQISSEIKGEFEEIYEDHLINQLKKIKNNKGTIYLSLSTPAYGYSALDVEDSKKLYDALNDLNHEHKIQLILFTPDAHYSYWTNTIFWAINKEGSILQNQFLKNFADHTLAFIRMFSTKNCQVWLKNETTVRFFGYKYSDSTSFQAVNLGYLSLVDNFTIYQDQSKGSFKARSLPIQSAHVGEFTNEDGSFFSKLKGCPYTLAEPLKASLELGDIQKGEDRQIAEKLAWDFILGRTSVKHYYVLQEFKDECVLYYEKVSKRFNSEETPKKKDDVMKNILLLYFEYIKSLDVSYQIIESKIISTNQIDKIKSTLRKIQSNEFESFKSYFKIDDGKSTNSNDNFEELLFEAISSGFQESAYVPLIKRRNAKFNSK